MGEGLYCHPSGKTAFVDLYDGLNPEDLHAAQIAYHDLVAELRGCLSDAWWPVEDQWRGRSGRIAARSSLHEDWLSEDSYGRVHVTFGLRHGLEEHVEPLAGYWMKIRAPAFFDRLQGLYPLRVRTGPWTSTERVVRRHNRNPSPAAGAP